MSKLTSFLTATGLTLTVTAAAFAGPTAKKMASNPVCPACKMTLTSKKTKEMTKAVMIKGKKYYCCADCKMKAPAKMKGATKKS